MSYDLNFGPDGDEPRPPDLAAWNNVVTQARDLLGDVKIFEDPPNWDLEHEGTGITVNHWEGAWGISVPYWWHGDAASRVVDLMYQVARIVERESGLGGQDPQLGRPLADVDTAAAVRMFDEVAVRYGRS
ncbi:hypothetical protein ACFFV7_12335 [Nonomuraea spiralis]|uniref:Uncharacterized protein n=1 Tax=Nonomuraea spiralis TaxID=46182 RepID=A0ABV5IBT5_9ACTN|nr:hypothetical protein [Nonomuraea spiralis]GGS79754.1 hypothetical protein GCM10010176_023910 [Nonomuraea spiralis]